MGRLTARRRMVAAAVAAGLAVLALAALAIIGATTRDRLAPGTTVGGVDVGGKSVADARSALQQRFGGLLDRPVTLVREDRRWTLTPGRSRVRVDIEAALDRARALSRGDGVITRGWRRIMGDDEDADVRPQVVWSRAAVRALARDVRERLSHAPRSADVEFTARGLERTPGRNGVTVRRERLVRAIEAKLRSAAPGRRVVVPVEITRRPRVTLAELRKKYPWLIGVDRGDRRLKLYRRLRPQETYEIAVGQAGHGTDPGRYEIQDKQVDPAWHAPDKEWAGELAGRTIPPGDPRNPLEARWMGFHDGQGIHGTADLQSLGSAASHGCIRMAVDDVKQLYRQVPVGTPVFIV